MSVARRCIHPLSVALAILPLAAPAQEARLDEVVVSAPKIDAPGAATAVGAASLQILRPATSDTASLLQGIPGVSLYGAGGVSSLPAIHGLADDRLRIKVDGMDLVASCPNHMNPPLSYLDPSQIGTLKVHAGITPVSVGGDSIGGTIVADTPEPEFAPPGQASLAKGQLSAFYRSNNQAHGGNLAATLATESFSLAYAGAFSQADNYQAGGDFRTSTATGRAGHTVALDEVGSTAYETQNHALAFALRSANHLIEARLGYQDMPYQLWPNQRMDLLGNTQQRLNLRYRGRFDWGALDARTYRETVDHFMDFGADKRYWYGPASGGTTAVDGAPCAPPGPTCAGGMPMHTESATTGVAVRADIALGDQDLLRLGGEYQGYRLDDWWPPSGGGMWPNTFWNVNDGRRDRAALFAEWEAPLDARWTTLLGARYERVTTDAGPVQAYNDAVAPATTLVPAFNGRDRKRTDDNWDFTALVRTTDDATRDIELGIARKLRSPNLYERYTWYSRGMEMLMINWVGDGNGYIGDMDLEPEVAHTVSATFDWHAPDRSWQFRATPYYTHVSDYIDAVRCPTSLGGACTTANQSAVDRFVYLQLANQSARLYGLDLSGRLPLARSVAGELGLEGVLGYTNGRNRDTGDPLYNIVPLTARVTLTQRHGGWDNRIELAMAGAKDGLSRVRNEIRTPGYALLNLRASYSWARVRVDFGVENLFDTLYDLPLGGAYVGQGTTMTTAGTSSPPWGVAVPGVGRSFYAGVNVAF